MKRAVCIMLGLFLPLCLTGSGEALNWDAVTIDEIPVSTMVNTTLRLDHRDNPRIVYLAGDQLKYAFCDSKCGRKANWTVLTLEQLNLNSFALSSLALNEAGNPRVAYMAMDEEHNIELRYAFCDDGCGDIASWTTIALEKGMAAFASGSASLVLDEAGNPRIAYSMNTIERFEQRYAFCDQGCDSPEGWSSIALVSEGAGGTASYGWMHHSLALAGNGAPRLVAVYQLDPFVSYYVYFHCDSDCRVPDNWNYKVLHRVTANQLVLLSPLVIDDSGVPRFSVGLGSYTSGVGLFFSECSDTDCLTTNSVLVESPAFTPALMLNSDENPRMACYGGGGVGSPALMYYSCDDGCLDKAGWVSEKVGAPPAMGSLPSMDMIGLDYPRIAYHSEEGLLRYVIGWEPIPWALPSEAGAAEEGRRGRVNAGKVNYLIFLLPYFLFLLLRGVLKRG